MSDRDLTSVVEQYIGITEGLSQCQAVASVTLRQPDERIGETKPRFYFHLRKGDEFIIDDEGLNLPGGRELLAGSSKRVGIRAGSDRRVWAFPPAIT